MSRTAYVAFLLVLVALPGWPSLCAAMPAAKAYSWDLPRRERADPLEAEALARIREARRRHGLGMLAWDPRLSAVAREHSADMAKHDYFHYASPRLGRLEYRLHRAGSSVGNVRYAIFRSNSVDGLARQLSKEEKPVHLHDDNRVGIGIVTKGRREIYATLILSRCYSSLRPFPTMPLHGRSYHLAGTLEKGLTAPKLVVTLPDGTVTDRDLALSAAGEISTVVDFNQGRGKYVVETMASGRLGPMVLDLMNCYAGAPYPEPDGPPASDQAPENLGRAEHEMLELINRERAKAGMKSLVPDERLAAVARGHSADMVRNHFFGHRSPGRGDLDVRMKRAGLAARSFTENIGNNRNTIAVHEGLMASPGHRKNILNPEVSRVGIGIVGHGDNIMVTQNFAEDFVTYDTGALIADFAKAVNAARHGKGLRALSTSRLLNRIARDNSLDMRRRGELKYDTAHKLLRKARPRYGVQIGVLKSVDPPKSTQFPKLLDADCKRLGVGIAQSDDRQGVRYLWTTVLFAK